MADTSNIYLRQAQIGPMANFVYLVGDPATRKLAVVDPAWDVEAIRKFAELEGYQIDKILITHYHPDHLGGHMMGQNIEGSAKLLEQVKAKVYVNRLSDHLFVQSRWVAKRLGEPEFLWDRALRIEEDEKTARAAKIKSGRGAKS